MNDCFVTKDDLRYLISIKTGLNVGEIKEEDIIFIYNNLIKYEGGKSGVDTNNPKTQHLKIDSDFMQFMNVYLKKQLAMGEEEGYLVDISFKRGIGKTHALIEYAKEHNYGAVLSNSSPVDIQRVRHRYERIYSPSYDIRESIVVVDENADLSKLRGIKVATGFVSKI